LSHKDIQTSGKTDINDIMLQLPQNYDNGLAQDLGNRTSGLTTAGVVATADLRGLGPNRTLVRGGRHPARQSVRRTRSSVARTRP